MVWTVVLGAALLVSIGLPVAFSLGLASIGGIVVGGTLPLEIVASFRSWPCRSSCWPAN